MRQTEEDKTKKFHGSRTFIARRPFTRPWDGSHGRHGGYSDGRTKPTESIRQSVKSSKPSLPSPPFPSLPPPAVDTFFIRRLCEKNDAIPSRNFSSSHEQQAGKKKSGRGEGEGKGARGGDNRARKKLSIFPRPGFESRPRAKWRRRGGGRMHPPYRNCEQRCT